MKEKTLIKVETPTTMLIIGSYDQNYESDISITDDNCGFSIMKGKRVFDNYAECEGVVSIMSLEDFLENREAIMNNDGLGDDDWDDAPYDSFLLRNFQGEIKLKVANECVYVDLDNINLEHNIESSIEIHEDDVCPDIETIIQIPEYTSIELFTAETLNSILKIENRKTILKDIKK